jgi:hypothetical protein
MNDKLFVFLMSLIISLCFIYYFITEENTKIFYTNIYSSINVILEKTRNKYGWEIKKCVYNQNNSEKCLKKVISEYKQKIFNNLYLWIKELELKNSDKDKRKKINSLYEDIQTECNIDINTFMHGYNDNLDYHHSWILEDNSACMYYSDCGAINSYISCVDKIFDKNVNQHPEIWSLKFFWLSFNNLDKWLISDIKNDVNFNISDLSDWIKDCKIHYFNDNKKLKKCIDDVYSRFSNDMLWYINNRHWKKIKNIIKKCLFLYKSRIFLEKNKFYYPDDNTIHPVAKIILSCLLYKLKKK